MVVLSYSYNLFYWWIVVVFILIAPSPKETADHGQNDWDVLKEAMDAIHEHKSTKVPLQHLHFLAHRQTSRSSVDLFNKISETFKRHIHSRRHKLISTISSEVEDFLLNIANDWEDFLRYTVCKFSKLHIHSSPHNIVFRSAKASPLVLFLAPNPKCIHSLGSINNHHII